MDGRSIFIQISILAASAAMVCGNALASPSSMTSASTRLEHARELLGRRYKKTIRTAEHATNVAHFVRHITEESLSKRWKRKAPRIARTIMQESKRYGFDPIFLVSVIQTESSFSPTARGSAGEIGLMQLRPETGKWIANEFDIRWRGKKTLYDPVQNIRIGAAYLSLLREKFGKDGRLYIPAYNMGATAVRDAVSQHIFPVEYARRVMSKYLKNYSKISLQLQLERERKVTEDRQLASRSDG